MSVCPTIASPGSIIRPRTYPGPLRYFANVVERDWTRAMDVRSTQTLGPLTNLPLVHTTDFPKPQVCN